MCISIATFSAKAQNQTKPDYAPQVLVIDQYGAVSDTLTTNSGAKEAPLQLSLRANPVNDDDWVATYQWIVTNTRTQQTVLDRYIPETETTFEINDYGEYSIYCYATFVNGNDTVKYNQDDENWSGKADKQPFKFTIAESHLEFPNAFSPNGDQINDKYGPKGLQEGTTNGPKSIVEYHMSIYNRWGQRLFDTHNLHDCWDGTYNGRDVKEGVYFVVVKAKGSDGVKYNIKKDVNLLRGKRERESSNP